MLKEQASLDAKLQQLEAEGDDKRFVDAREEYESRLAEVHQQLADMDAASAPARAAELLAGRYYSEAKADTLLTCALGLGFDETDQKKPTKSFSGGWRMRLALARALFVKVSKANWTAT